MPGTLRLGAIKVSLLDTGVVAGAETLDPGKTSQVGFFRKSGRNRCPATGGAIDTQPNRWKLISFCFVAVSMSINYGTLLLGDALEYRAALQLIFQRNDA